MLEKYVLTILELNLEPALEKWEDKIEHLSSNAHVVHTPAKQVISRRRKNENFLKMSKNEKCTCEACKILFFIVKYGNLWGFCCHRRRGCLSSLLWDNDSSTKSRPQYLSSPTHSSNAGVLKRTTGKHYSSWCTTGFLTASSRNQWLRLPSLC